MLRDYAVRFSQRGASPGLLRDYAVDARAISTGAFDACGFPFGCYHFYVACLAREWRHRFRGSCYCDQLGVPVTT
jgi:hypothetical protein